MQARALGAALVSLAKLGAASTWIALLCGFAGPWAWPLDLFANFRVQYGALLVACLLVLLAARQLKWVLPTAAGAVFCWISVLAHIGWPAGVPTSARPEHFRLVTFNVWFRNEDLERTARFLEDSRADAVILQELEQSKAAKLRDLLPSYPFAQIGAGPHGAVIFSRWPLLEQHFEPLCEDCVAIARTRLQWRERSVTLLGAHLHWPLGPEVATLRRKELEALADLVRAQPTPLLLGGDFNLTPWSQHFARFTVRSGLEDCARRQGWKPTWPRWPWLLRIRIDQCFASAEWRTEAVVVGPELGSDHLPNVVDLQLR
jgi:endonuclease/exonuclease/phosphatase (EEP) superfamily protein YafD